MLVTQQRLADTQESHSTKQEASSQIQEISGSEAGGGKITLLEKVQNPGAESRRPSREEEHACNDKGSTSSRPSTLCHDTGPWFSFLNLFALFSHWVRGETINLVLLSDLSTPCLIFSNISTFLAPLSGGLVRLLQYTCPNEALILVLKTDQPPHPC